MAFSLALINSTLLYQLSQPSWVTRKSRGRVGGRTVRTPATLGRFSHFRERFQGRGTGRNRHQIRALEKCPSRPLENLHGRNTILRAPGKSGILLGSSCATLEGETKNEESIGVDVRARADRFDVVICFCPGRRL